MLGKAWLNSNLQVLAELSLRAKALRGSGPCVTDDHLCEQCCEQLPVQSSIGAHVLEFRQVAELD